MTAQSTKRPGALVSLARAMRSWRTASVVLLSFSSGLPLGLVWYSIPDWMRSIGVDIRVVGLFSLAQAPWTFKFLWSPLMDRYPLPFLGRKRGWILASQAVLFGLGLWLAAVSGPPVPVAVIGALTDFGPLRAGRAGNIHVERERILIHEITAHAERAGVHTQ